MRPLVSPDACLVSPLRGTRPPSPSTAHPGGPPWVCGPWNLALWGWATLPCENSHLPLRFRKALALEPSEGQGSRAVVMEEMTFMGQSQTMQPRLLVSPGFLQSPFHGEPGSVQTAAPVNRTPDSPWASCRDPGTLRSLP